MSASCFFPLSIGRAEASKTRRLITLISVGCLSVLVLMVCLVGVGESAAKKPTRQTHPPMTEEIPLVKSGGVYELPIEINGVLTRYFVLDSGAADVQIPADIALTLYRTGTIRDADFFPGKTYVLADGSTVRSARVLLRSLTVGRRRITNVPASIGSHMSLPLLGQSFLQRLGTWSVDNRREVLVVAASPSAATSAQAPGSTLRDGIFFPQQTEAPQTLVVSPLRLSSQVAHVGQRLTVQLEATNTSTRSGHGVIMVNYPGHLVSFMALHAVGQETIAQFPVANVGRYQLLWSHWPVWAPGERRTAIIALVPRLAKDTEFSVL